jgi:hypothetical protein
MKMVLRWPHSMNLVVLTMALVRVKMIGLDLERDRFILDMIQFLGPERYLP